MFQEKTSFQNIGTHSPTIGQKQTHDEKKSDNLLRLSQISSFET